MPNLYIFTVGTSLLSNLERHPEGVGLASWLSQWLQGHTTERILGGGDENRPAAERALAYYGSDDCPQWTAELGSFLLLPPLREADQVVLLASDTPEGAFSALVNAHLMVKADAGPAVPLWEEEGKPGIRFNWNTAEIGEARSQRIQQRARKEAPVMRIQGLNPGDPNGFENEAVGNLVLTIARLVMFARATRPALDPMIVFTGGFKVSLPVLTQAASWLRGVPMVGMHEASNRLITIPVLKSDISIPLRNAVLGWAWNAGRQRQQIGTFFTESELRKWANASSMSFAELDTDLMPAFMRPDGGIQLNILGEALLAVILATLPTRL